MLTCEHIEQIIDQCREAGEIGLNNGIHASFPILYVDVVTPPLDFLGANSNPAIFINKETFKLLGSMHSNWIENRTIALKDSLLNKDPLDIIGAVVHETGHAFNVAAGIENSETNAYIFEIEVLYQLFRTNKLSVFDCSALDLRCYFMSRMPYYLTRAHHTPYLTDLIATINTEFKIEQKKLSSGERRIYSSMAHDNLCTFFSSAPKARNIVSDSCSKMNRMPEPSSSLR